MGKYKPLTHEETRGTKTYHLPLERGPETKPEVTLMVRRMPDGSYHAAMSICAKGDQFEKHRGRRAAFHRLNGNPIVAVDAEELRLRLRDRFFQLEKARPGTISQKTEEDMVYLSVCLDETFNQLEANRTEKFLKLAADKFAQDSEVGGC